MFQTFKWGMGPDFGIFLGNLFKSLRRAHFGQGLVLQNFFQNFETQEILTLKVAFHFRMSFRFMPS
jgi:hypothetical protein